MNLAVLINLCAKNILSPLSLLAFSSILLFPLSLLIKGLAEKILCPHFISIFINAKIDKRFLPFIIKKIVCPPIKLKNAKNIISNYESINKIIDDHNSIINSVKVKK